MLQQKLANFVFTNCPICSNNLLSDDGHQGYEGCHGAGRHITEGGPQYGAGDGNGRYAIGTMPAGGIIPGGGGGGGIIGYVEYA